MKLLRRGDKSIRGFPLRDKVHPTCSEGRYSVCFQASAFVCLRLCSCSFCAYILITTLFYLCQICHSCLSLFRFLPFPLPALQSLLPSVCFPIPPALPLILAKRHTLISRIWPLILNFSVENLNFECKIVSRFYSV